MNKLKRFDDTKEYWQEVSPFLRKEEAKNNLSLGISFLSQEKPESCLYQSALFQGDEFLGSMVVSSYGDRAHLLPSPFATASAAEALFADLRNSGLNIDGIIGEKTTSSFYKNLFEKSGHAVSVKMEQGIYACQRVVMPKVPQEVQLRWAEPKDVDVIAHWVESFQKEAVPYDPPPDGAKIAKTKIEGRNIFVLENNGELQSMAAFGRDIGTSCAVNLVYTPKPFRKKGYASVVTAQLTKQLLAEGRRQTQLFTDMSNPTSNKIYQDIGYEFVCHSVHYEVQGTR